MACEPAGPTHHTRRAGRRGLVAPVRPETPGLLRRSGLGGTRDWATTLRLHPASCTAPGGLWRASPPARRTTLDVLADAVSSRRCETTSAVCTGGAPGRRDALVLLSDIDGLYDCDPRKPRTRRHSGGVRPADLDGVVAGRSSHLDNVGCLHWWRTWSARRFGAAVGHRRPLRLRPAQAVEYRDADRSGRLEFTRSLRRRCSTTWTSCLIAQPPELPRPHWKPCAGSDKTRS